LALPFKIVYSPNYNLNLGSHVFPAVKYQMIYERLLREGTAEPADFIAPEPASDDDMLRVHTPHWVTALRQGTLSYKEIIQLEIPYSPEMVDAVWLSTGGTILAGRRALEDGFCYNDGGGFHHAFPGHGEGFCAINDVAVAIRRLQIDRLIKRAMVVDCDVHHGNGTAAIFLHDESVMTFSIHQFANYPDEKPPSGIDIDLRDNCSDEEYMAKLTAKLPPAIESFQPEIIYYLAGADPYFQDQLGGLALTIDGLKWRDRFVFDTARGKGVPVAVVLAGGYAINVNDTVTIHANTVSAAKLIFGESAT
jgi:acetoin utilization deacetylase AcuC-like enzyme